MPATEKQLTIEQGATYEFAFNFKIDGTAVDLTNYSARMQIRETVDAVSTAYSATNGGDITLNHSSTTGRVYLKIPATTTAAFTFTSGVYDFELEDADGFVYRVYKGKVKLDKEVTR